MLRIRKKQEEALRASRFAEFEDAMIVHLKQFFPDACLALGNEALKEVIVQGIDRASNYGIISRRDVMLYIDIMLIIGRDFDSDPNMPWARLILVDPTLPEPARRMRRLYQTALAQVKMKTET